ncbi:hypothetical protein VNO77_21321 [Canavalia gladiata]|uniref:Lipoyl-binding domain-containing protein n=1 Tax=Canavalia gladiata TaxID=3824 RepID=A0AAN9LVY1_CANGL
MIRTETEHAFIHVVLNVSVVVSAKLHFQDVGKSFGLWTKNWCGAMTWKALLFSTNMLLVFPFFFSQTSPFIPTPSLIPSPPQTLIFSPFRSDHSVLLAQKQEKSVFDSWGCFQMASFTVPCPKCPSFAHLGLNSQTPERNMPMVSYRSGLGLKKSLLFGSLSCDSASNGIQCHNRKQFSVWKCQVQSNKTATVENSSNSAPTPINGPKVSSPKEKDDGNGKPSGPSTSADASSVSAFMNQVSELVKLVDSRDIVELQLKQGDCELMIRKKEALQPPPAAVVAPMSQPFPYPTNLSLPAPPPPPVAASAPASPPPSKAPPALPAPGKASTSSHPSLKCPMAGTFYRSPAPGEPPFVKVGDKVQKGQVVCIIEAMKLMNEIEADRSGTIAEIPAEDGKPVSVDMPLFVIVP